MDGLEKFREAFADYTENYVIIGGTACELNMADTVVRARATIAQLLYLEDDHTIGLSLPA